MNNLKYIKENITNFIKYLNKDIKLNIELQYIYNQTEYNKLLDTLEEYNRNLSVPYLATGMSCYFNNQVIEQGLSNLKLTKQDATDAKFIAACFDKNINYSENELSILYTTLLGTTEFNYGMQTFPAGIFEDVFQCPKNHSFPLQPMVGEKEPDFFNRILEFQISNHPNFPLEIKDEVIKKGKRLATKFCSEKNRIYLIPVENIKNNKASFGDVKGLRDGTLKGEKLKEKLDTLYTLDKLLKINNISLTKKYNPYNNPNMTSEYGIAIYGPIDSKGISFFEIYRKYELMQKIAIKLGYEYGKPIPQKLDINKIKTLK